jgi:hypothetical protein
MLTFSEAVGEVRKVGQTKPKSRFPQRSPEWMRTQVNQASNDATRRKVPNQQRTKPLGPGEEEDPELSDPYAELEEKAAALRKANPTLSEADAFTRTYLNPANTDLVKREHAQRMAKIARAGAA